MFLDIKILDEKLRIDQVIRNKKLILKIRNYCDKGKIVILKKIFSKKRLNNILKKNLMYFKESKPFVPKIYNFNLLDFFRIDKNVKKSTIKKNQIIYFYPLNLKKKNEVREFSKKISILRNMIAGLKKNYGENNNDKHIGIGTIQHYPNKGFMSEHYDPKFPQKVVVSVILEDDFLEGGLSVKINKNFINIDNFLQKGDIVIHPSSILHKVEVVNTKSKKLFAGRWRATSVLLPVQK